MHFRSKSFVTRFYGALEVGWGRKAFKRQHIRPLESAIALIEKRKKKMVRTNLHYTFLSMFIPAAFFFYVQMFPPMREPKDAGRRYEVAGSRAISRQGNTQLTLQITQFVLFLTSKFNQRKWGVSPLQQHMTKPFFFLSILLYIQISSFRLCICQSFY